MSSTLKHTPDELNAHTANVQEHTPALQYVAWSQSAFVTQADAVEKIAANAKKAAGKTNELDLIILMLQRKAKIRASKEQRRAKLEKL